MTLPFGHTRGSLRALGLIDRRLAVVFVIITMLFGVSGQADQQTPQPANPPRGSAAAPAKPTVAKPAGMTNADVVNMAAAGLSEQIIISSIRDAKARSFDVTPNGLIALKKGGVTDTIIAVMMNPTAPPTAVPATSAPAAGASANTSSAAIRSVSSELRVGDGTEVKLRLARPVSSASARLEDRVDFEVLEDVKVDGVIVIAKGASAVGRITEAQSKRSFGRSGKLNFTIDSVKATDDQSIRLRTTREMKGGDSFGKAGVVTLLAGPFGALVRGKDVDIPAGTEYTIYIDGDRNIQLKPAP